jgi:HlyD family secretion protein
MKKKIMLGLVLAIACLALLGATACNPFGGDEEQVSQQMVEVTRGDITISVTGSGKIETSREARVAFGSAGRVDEILVKEGDQVSQGEVLARLDTSALELARNQAKAALTQAEVALTQAQLAYQTAEYSLKNTRDTEGMLELALFNAQINVEQAQRNLDTGIVSADYDAITAELRKAKAWYEYVLNSGEYARDDPRDLALAQDRAEERLEAAQARYDNLLAGYETQEITIKKKPLEAAEMARAQAQKDLDELAEDIAVQELQVASANQTIIQNRQSVELAQQSLDEAQRQLDEATIVAPFSGLVAQVLAKEGDNIPSPSMAPTTIIYLIDPDLMELVVAVDEIDIPLVRLNQGAVITVDALPDAEFKGTVTAVYPVPKDEAGVVLYDVRLSIDAPEKAGIRVGMSASSDIKFEERSQVLLVPSRAIGEDDQGGTIVKVMSGEQIEERPVVVGLDDGLRAEIVSGLSEGETVVVETRVKSSSGTSMWMSTN